MRNAAGSSFRIEYFYFSYLFVLFYVMMCYVCHQHGMGIKPDDIFAFNFCSKLVIYVIVCKRCFPVYVHNVRYACLCGVKRMLSGLFFLYAGMLRNAGSVMADAVKDRRVGWFLSSFCP